MVNRLAGELAVNRVPLTLVFQAPTLALLPKRWNNTAYLTGGAPGEQPEKAPRRVIPRLPRGPQGPEGGWVLPASFGQRRLWLIDQLNPHSATYNVPWAVRLSGNLNVSALARSLDEVVRRHESLRTTFRAGTGASHYRSLARRLRYPCRWPTCARWGQGVRRPFCASSSSRSLAAL